MPRLDCEEFDQFVEALSGLEGRYLLRTRQSRHWRLRLLDLNGVILAAGHEGAGRIYNGVAQNDYFHAYVVLDDRNCINVDGKKFNSGQVAWVAPGMEFHTVTGCPISWINISIATSCVTRWVRSHEDEFDASLLRSSVIVDAGETLPILIRLVRRLFQAEENTPDKLHSPMAQRAAREQVLRALARCLGRVRPKQAHRVHHRRVRILDGALELLNAIGQDVVHVPDLCQATGASERTLRNVFHDYLGMSPHQYLMINRLHAVRAAIRHAGPGDTVTGMCARYGIWDFGRFATSYRESFGILPSKDLRRQSR